jgi:streptomycin 6-kinase
MQLPSALVDEWQHEPEWLAALPALVAECVEQWSLELEEPIDTAHALVVPAGDVVLKLNARSHFEADHEAEALERWAGDGAVHVVARDDARRAYLCERCRPGTTLTDARADQVPIVAALLPRLSLELERPHPFRLLAGEAERWAEEVPRRWELGGRPFERPLLDAALDVYRSVDRKASFLVNQDLHGWNVLRATREPWLVIDPKPLVGEREIDGVGLLRNAALGDDPTSSVRRWLDVLADLGLDRERTRAWGVAHALAWAWRDAGGWDGEQVAVAGAIASA